MPAPPAVRYRLTRQQRLCRPGAFAAAKARGRRHVGRCFILNWLKGATLLRGRVGVVTSRKVGSAVVRNRARRLLREVYRRNQHALREPMDLVIVARPAIAGMHLADVEREYLAALRRNALVKVVA